MNSLAKVNSFSDTNIVLSKEFESVGFYISNHPLQEYLDALDQYKVKTFKNF